MNKEKVLKILQEELPHGGKAKIAKCCKVSSQYVGHVLKGLVQNQRIIDYAVEWLENYRKEEEAIYAIKLNKLTGGKND